MKKEICHQMNIAVIAFQPPSPRETFHLYICNLKTEICHTVLPSYSVMIVLQLCWQSQKKEVWDPDPVIRCRALRGEGEGGVR